MRGNQHWLNRFSELGASKRDRSYLTVPELRRFREMRESGAMTVFRCASCARCKAEIPESFIYCSKECWERETMSPSRAATKQWQPRRRVVPVNDKGDITSHRATGWIIHPEDRAVRAPPSEKQQPNQRHKKARKVRAKE